MTATASAVTATASVEPTPPNDAPSPPVSIEGSRAAFLAELVEQLVEAEATVATLLDMIRKVAAG